MLEISLKGGTSMPALGMGTYLLKGEACISAVGAAIRVGYRHIDTAQVYGNESAVGTAIKKSALPRSEIFLTTKVWTDSFHECDLEKSVDDSLLKLKTDYVDLLLLHWPNPKVPMAETMASLNEVLKAGKTKAIGLSNFTVAFMDQGIALSEAPLAVNQVEYHVLLSQKAVLTCAKKNHMAITAYSPLAQGRARDLHVLSEVGAQYGKSALQVALRWLVQQDNVAAIPKASSEKNLRMNFEIFDFTLSEADLLKINALQGNTRINNFDFSPVWDK